MPLTGAALSDWLREKELVNPAQADELRAQATRFPDLNSLLKDLVKRGWLTYYQAARISHGEGPELALGQYRVVDLLGEGAMGRVYKARHVRTDKRVALKIIHKEKLTNVKAVERFLKEIIAATELRHDNIVKAVDSGQVNGSHFLAMELIEGTDLSRLVKQRGPLPPLLACELLRQAALALQHAFERGVVHRDIKPSNLLVAWTADKKPQIKMLDFGLARFESESDAANRLTQLGNLVGTVDYMAPEQAENARTADIRADIYSLGCTLYFLLTGKTPFTGNSAVEKLSARMMGQPPRIRQARPELPASLEAVVLKMMARRPEDRYQTPSEAAAALVPFARGEVAVDAIPVGAGAGGAVDAVPVFDAFITPPARTGGTWDFTPSHVDDSGAARAATSGMERMVWYFVAIAGALFLILMLIILFRS